MDEFVSTLDSDQWTNESPPFTDESHDKIGFHDALFSWGDSPFTLKIEGSLLFEPGITLITGATGSGKTSLLMALLGSRFSGVPYIQDG